MRSGETVPIRGISPLLEGTAMKSLLSLALMAVFVGSFAYAGGPVVVVEDTEPVVEEKPASSVGVLPWLAVPLILCIVMCGPDDDGPQT